MLGAVTLTVSAHGGLDRSGCQTDHTRPAGTVRVKGDSMHPAIRHGWLVVVEPNGRCVIGEYVALQLRCGRKMVKELVIERHDEVVVESVNGNQRRTIDRADIESMCPVGAIVLPSKWRAA